MNRRHLLRSSTFAGTWSLLAPFARAQGANEELRVVVIGVRGRGGKHLASVVSHPKARLVGMCDVDEGQLEKRLKKYAKVKTYTDYRKVCEDPEVDAITVATCNHTHALIALTAAANGKHVFLEKPISHNIMEGEKLTAAQAKTGLVMAHGFQRRSEEAWAKAFAWIAEGNLGKLKLARGLCYKPRKSIGKAKGPVKVADTINYDLWCGPREVKPLRRKNLHYDWHWQAEYGNGDLGNQGVHQLDVCRWALGDPKSLPKEVMTAGGRYGYDDDGDTANTSVTMAKFDEGEILFEVRGLPKAGMDWKKGMNSVERTSVGNIIEYEGGKLIGGHTSTCRVVDADGKEIKKFQSRNDHLHVWVEACLRQKQNAMHGMESGHFSAAIAQAGDYAQENQAKKEPEVAGRFNEAFGRMKEHLAANGVTQPVAMGLAKGSAARGWKREYRKGFELPEV